MAPPHHRAWLLAHPERSLQWLDAHIEDGFEIHHRDRDHENNDPANLVLIEATDHRRLHGQSLIGAPYNTSGRKIDVRMGELAYHGRVMTNEGWAFIAERLGKLSPQRAERAAAHYAFLANLPWPLPRAKRQGKIINKRTRPIYTGLDL